MNYYILFYETVADYVEQRKPYREQHLARAAKAVADGTIVMAGAYEPADGAALVFRTETETEVEDFAKHDPYVINGLVTKWWIRKWTVVVGNE